VFSGLDTTLPQSIINRQSDTNLRMAALSAFAALAPNMDQTEGSFVFDLIEPFCLVLAQAYSDLIDIERRNSLATATGADLDRLGDLYAISRGPSSFAEGVVTFTGASGAVVPANTVVTTSGPNAQFFTTANVPYYIPTGPPIGTVDVPVVANNTGPGGNVPTGTVTLFSGPPPQRITAVTNNTVFTGGADLQPDGPINQYYQGYRSDIYVLENTRGEGGAAKHLRKWARSVNGVGGVQVQEITPTAGWATVVILGTTGLPATPDIIHNVEAAIVDPWYLYNEAEGMTLQGAAALASLSDATPLNGTNNCVLLHGASAAGIRQFRLDRQLPQPGVWRLKPAFKVSTTTPTTSLVTIGIYDLTTAGWCYQRPNNAGGSAVATFTANQLSAAFVVPDVDPTHVDFAWNGIDPIELHIDLGTVATAGGTGTPVDTTTNLWVDQVNYFAVMSRDDRDLGLSPAGMRVSVIPAVAVTVNVAATVTYALTTGQTISMVNANINTNVTAYFQSVAFTSEPMIRRAAVEEAIYTTPGVGDVNLVTLNTGTANIPIGPTQVGVVGTMIWTPG
jgi:uncharacterized phage protein gp47/JayE